MTANDLTSCSVPLAERHTQSTTTAPSGQPHPSGVWLAWVVRRPLGRPEGMKAPPLVRIELVQVLAAEHGQDGRIAEPLLRQPGVQLTIMVVLERRSAPMAMGSCVQDRRRWQAALMRKGEPDKPGAGQLAQQRRSSIDDSEDLVRDPQVGEPPPWLLHYPSPPS